jgi:hypothetical protein
MILAGIQKNIVIQEKIIPGYRPVLDGLVQGFRRYDELNSPFRNRY